MPGLCFRHTKILGTQIGDAVEHMHLSVLGDMLLLRIRFAFPTRKEKKIFLKLKQKTFRIQGHHSPFGRLFGALGSQFVQAREREKYGRSHHGWARQERST